MIIGMPSFWSQHAHHLTSPWCHSVINLIAQFQRRYFALWSDDQNFQVKQNNSISFHLVFLADLLESCCYFNVKQRAYDTYFGIGESTTAEVTHYFCAGDPFWRGLQQGHWPDCQGCKTLESCPGKSSCLLLHKFSIFRCDSISYQLPLSEWLIVYISRLNQPSLAI